MSTAASTGGGGSSGGAAGGSSVVIVQSSGGGQQSTGGASSGPTWAGWGDGWRGQMAAGSTDPDKEAAQLARYESPEQVWRKTRELEKKMSSGELRSTLKKDATPQEVAQYRKDNGIPEKAEGYKINMPAGVQPPAEDDGFLKSFLASAHAQNYNQGQVDAAINTFYAEVDRAHQSQQEDEKKLSDATEDQLRKEWGADYRPNKAMAEALLARAPAGFRDRFMNGYLVEKDAKTGRSSTSPIKASADAWKWLVQMEREINPAATVVPGATGDLGKTIADEKASLLKNSQAAKGSAAYKSYWEGGGEVRYRELVAAEQKMKAKAA